MSDRLYQWTVIQSLLQYDISKTPVQRSDLMVPVNFVSSDINCFVVVVF